jgi:HEPN domain-containing protein
MAEIVRGWARKADGDLRNAEIVLAAAEPRPLDTVLFHSQQCVEKYLKAALAFRGTRVPRTHDIEELLALAELEAEVGMTALDVRKLSSYAVALRSSGHGRARNDRGSARSRSPCAAQSAGDPTNAAAAHPNASAGVAEALILEGVAS